MAKKSTESIEFEFFKQVAIFTLKNDLKSTEGQIKQFEDMLQVNLESISRKVISEGEKEIRKRAKKESDFIQQKSQIRKESEAEHWGGDILKNT